MPYSLAIMFSALSQSAFAADACVIDLISTTIPQHELKWHSDTSLPNKFPHNSRLERSVRTTKSGTRANMLQCGGNDDATAPAFQHACIALSIMQKAPVLEHEKNESGKVAPGYAWKPLRTCWEAHHGGEPFFGPRQPFGRLCWFYKKAGNTMTPNAAPGLFLGWKINFGMRYLNYHIQEEILRLREFIHQVSSIFHYFWIDLICLIVFNINFEYFFFLQLEIYILKKKFHS